MSSYQITVKSNYMFASTTLSDWLKNLVSLFFNQWKPKPITPYMRNFFRVLNKLRAIARNSDWFTALFSLVVIGRRNKFGIGILTWYINHKEECFIRYPNTEKWIEKTRRSRVFLNQLRSVWISNETFFRVFAIASQSINNNC